MNPTIYRNRRTLFLGEVSSGKTTRTREILLAFLREGEEGIALFDFAPERIGEVGGRFFSPKRTGAGCGWNPRGSFRPG